MSDEPSLNERLTTAYVNAGNHFEKAEKLTTQAESIGVEYQQDLPTHSADWSSEAVNNYLSQLESAVNDPRISQARSTLKNLGLGETQIKTIPDDKLEDASKIQNICDTYDELVDEFGAEFVDFLVDEGVLLEWIQNHELDLVQDRIDVVGDTKVSELHSLSNISNEITQLYLRGYLDNSRNITSAQDLDRKIKTLSELGINTAYNGDFDRYERLINDTENYYTQLESDFGYPESELRDWVDGEDLEDARDTLQTKHDEAGTKRTELREEIQEYCELLKKEAPDEDAIPALVEHLDELQEELAEELGDTGERLLRYLRGEDVKLPDDSDSDDLIQGIKRIQPFIRNQLSETDD